MRGHSPDRPKRVWFLSVALLAAASSIFVIVSRDFYAPADRKSVKALLTTDTQQLQNLWQIEAALTALLLRTQPDGVVRIEDQLTGKFVLFAGSRSESLLLDLPARTLSARDMKRARHLFESLGAPGSRVSFADGPRARPDPGRFSFTLHFPTAAAGARFVLRLFRDVYAFRGSPRLRIISN